MGSLQQENRPYLLQHLFALVPDWCIEHVVVHELAHLIEANHGPKFHALMDRYYPRWKEARKATREITKKNIVAR